MIKELSKGVECNIARNHGRVANDTQGVRISPAEVAAFKTQEPKRSCALLGTNSFISEHGCRQYQASATRYTGHKGKDKLDGSLWRRKLKLQYCVKCSHATDETIKFVEGKA